MKFQLATAAAALLFVLAATMVGAQRTAALTGATIAGATALVSIWAMGRAAHARGNATQGMLAVMAVLFLVRLVLVGLGTVLTARAGRDAIAFVVAFFVPYFAFSALEGAFVHSLRRQGTTA